MWDARNVTVPVWEAPKAHGAAVRGVVGNGNMCMSVSFDKTVRLFDSTHGTEISKFVLDEKLVACDIHKNGNSAVVSGVEGGCFVFSLN